MIIFEVLSKYIFEKVLNVDNWIKYLVIKIANK